MLIDTDVMIWLMRGNDRAASAVQETWPRSIAIVTYMEMVHGLRSREQIRAAKSLLKEQGFVTLGLSEDIAHRAAIYMEEYAPSIGLCVVDALIAATAAELGLPLLTGNDRHFQPILGLDVRPFRP